MQWCHHRTARQWLCDFTSTSIEVHSKQREKSNHWCSINFMFPMHWESFAREMDKAINYFIFTAEIDFILSPLAAFHWIFFAAFAIRQLCVCIFMVGISIWLVITYDSICECNITSNNFLQYHKYFHKNLIAFVSMLHTTYSQSRQENQYNRSWKIFI